MRLPESEQIEESFAYLTIYKDSLSEGTEIGKAESLISYFGANKAGQVFEAKPKPKQDIH